MKHLRNIKRAALLLAASVLLLAGSAVTAAAATAGSGTATSGTAWIRLAHLSPDTPAVDVYLYSFGEPKRSAARGLRQKRSLGLCAKFWSATRSIRRSGGMGPRWLTSRICSALRHRRGNEGSARHKRVDRILPESKPERRIRVANP